MSLFQVLANDFDSFIQTLEDDLGVVVTDLEKAILAGFAAAEAGFAAASPTLISAAETAVTSIGLAALNGQNVGQAITAAAGTLESQGEAAGIGIVTTAVGAAINTLQAAVPSAQ